MVPPPTPPILPLHQQQNGNATANKKSVGVAATCCFWFMKLCSPQKSLMRMTPFAHFLLLSLFWFILKNKIMNYYKWLLNMSCFTVPRCSHCSWKECQRSEGVGGIWPSPNIVLRVASNVGENWCGSARWRLWTVSSISITFCNFIYSTLKKNLSWLCRLDWQVK